MTAASYDAIVVGSGITGGWAAKELCERGLRTLLIELTGPVVVRRLARLASFRKLGIDFSDEAPP